MAIINGRRISVPESGVYGSELIQAMEPAPGRRVVIGTDGLHFESVNPMKRYTKAELLDRSGNSVKMTEIPDRVVATVNYGGNRGQLSKTIITEQVLDIADKLFKSGVDFDEENADWMVVPRYRLPESWHSIARFSPLLVVFPTDYPKIPPVGFYLKEDVSHSPNGHLFSQAYHEASKDPLDEGWKWYCVYVMPGSWQPASYRYPGDWRRGDNLWTYFTLISESLTVKE